MSQEIIENIKKLFHKHFQESSLTCEAIPLAGSDRCYFRLQSANNKAIGTYNENLLENKSFIYFAKHFQKQGIEVPNIYTTSEDKLYYLQEDLGGQDFFKFLQKNTDKDIEQQWIEKIFEQLTRLQYQGHQNLDYSVCFNGSKFDYDAIMADLYYFKYYFLRPQKIIYNGQEIIKNFNLIANHLMEADNDYFMMRDFQSRNIMLHNHKPYIIDFQGGKQGPLQYDVVSMLWQARSGFSVDAKRKYFELYIETAKKNIPNFNENSFRKYYEGFVLIRLLQVLGSYGYRGLFEGREHFIKSIPLALQNLQWWLNNMDISVPIHELKKALSQLVSEQVISQYKTNDIADNQLQVSVNSFSYKKCIPKDESGNGGGFVFDCRIIYNPGRHEEFKHLTGRDQDVKLYLEQNTIMPLYLKHVFALVDKAVENYAMRGFHSLQINFGCTGGQHRSVYAADATAKHISDKYNVKVNLQHIEQESKNWINT